MDTSSSLDIIKQELIKQRQLLEAQGIVVNTTYTNPSPSEITTALGGITTDFDQADATPEDVRAGKTFFGNSNEIKTGTLDLSLIDQQKQYIETCITGQGDPVEISIPEDPKYTQIRKYAFGAASDNANMFYKENLVIPSNITKLGEGAFMYSNLTGSLVVPSSCTTVYSGCFAGTNLTEATVSSTLSSNSSAMFNSCPILKKVVFTAPVKYIPATIFAYATKLEEVHFPPTLTNIVSTAFHQSHNTKIWRFTNPTPFNMSSNTLQYAKKASLLVPYQSYDAYFNATNFQQFSNPMFGWGEFVAGDTLPSMSEDGLYTITWHPTLDDATNVTNAMETCTEDAMLYAVFTEIPVEEDTEETTT